MATVETTRTSTWGASQSYNPFVSPQAVTNTAKAPFKKEETLSKINVILHSSLIGEFQQLSSKRIEDIKCTDKLHCLPTPMTIEMDNGAKMIVHRHAWLKAMTPENELNKKIQELTGFSASSYKTIFQNYIKYLKEKGNWATVMQQIEGAATIENSRIIRSLVFDRVTEFIDIFKGTLSPEDLPFATECELLQEIAPDIDDLYDECIIEIEKAPLPLRAIVSSPVPVKAAATIAPASPKQPVMASVSKSIQQIKAAQIQKPDQQSPFKLDQNAEKLIASGNHAFAGWRSGNKIFVSPYVPLQELQNILNKFEGASFYTSTKEEWDEFVRTNNLDSRSQK